MFFLFFGHETCESGCVEEAVCCAVCNEKSIKVAPASVCQACPLPQKNQKIVWDIILFGCFFEGCLVFFFFCSLLSSLSFTRVVVDLIFAFCVLEYRHIQIDQPHVQCCRRSTSLIFFCHLRGGILTVGLCFFVGQ